MNRGIDMPYNYQSEDSDSDDVSIEVSLIDEEEEAEGSKSLSNEIDPVYCHLSFSRRRTFL